MRKIPLLTVAALVAHASGCHAASLRVSPILIDAGNATDMALTLRNQDVRPIDAQVRVFRWLQKDGQDDLEPTEDVVVSPPILTIAPEQDYTVRLQRTLGARPVGEEAYRVVVDELPNPNRQRNGTVAMVLRYVIPAFFYAPDTGQPRLKWSLRQQKGHLTLTAENTGEEHIQISNLGIRERGHIQVLQKGLAGYVLGHSSREWTLGVRLPSSGSASVVAGSDHGAVDVPLAP